MSEIRHRHRILEAIDQLRRRKARPDVNRICSFMFRRFSVSCGETKADLQKLIDAEIVIKVDYKGNTSYRNAAKWAMLPNYKNKQELDSSNTSSILSSAVAELIVLEPDYLDIGVPALELEKHLLKKDTKRFTKKNLENVLKREIENGTLVKLENGNYFLGEHSNASKQNSSNSTTNSNSKSVNKTQLSAKPKTKKLKLNKPVEAPPTFDTVQTENNCSNLEYKEELKEKMDENVTTNSNSSTTNSSVTTTSSSATNINNSENVAFRVGGRQKRVKVMLDPSDNNLPKIKARRAKVMFDPSDNNLPKISRKRPPGRPPISVGKSISSVNRASTNSSIRSSSIANTSSSSSLLIGGSCVTIGPSKSAPSYQSVNTSPAPSVPLNNPSICCLCHSYGVRIKGVPERLITCADCSCSKAHPSCIETKREGSCRNRNGLWQCIQCKRCTICDETGKAGKIAFCTTCSEAYHYICHNPHVPLTMIDMDKWECSKCTSITKIKSTSMNNTVNNNNEECKDNEDVKDILPVKVEATTSSISTSGIKNSSKIINNINSDNNKNSCLVVSSTGSALVNDVSSRTSTGGQSSSSSSISCCVVSTTSSETAPKIICSPSNQSSSTTITTAASKIDVTESVKEEKPVTAKPVNVNNDVNETANNVQTKKEFVVPVLNDDSPLAREPKSQYLLPPGCLQDPYDGYPVDDTIPDASHWSPQEVFQYFVKHFDASTAKIFKDQEIDGQSLLLMKRADVLTGLCLKLGPALKVYSHVKKLQIRRSHPKLLWS